MRLAEAIDHACDGLGLAREDKPWRPHLTLARIKEGERSVGHALSDAGLFEKPALSDALIVTTIALVRSDAGPAGHVHTTLWTTPPR
jgi:2'-5' RNA ligase